MKGLILGFDTEQDTFEYADYYSKQAMERSLNSIRQIRSYIDEFSATVTFFLVGRLVEQSPSAFKEILCRVAQLEIASHTYSHQVRWKEFPWTSPGHGTIDEIRYDIEQGTTVLKKVFGIESVEGLCVPGNFYRGLQDRPDLLKLLIECGLRYICSDGRGPTETIPAPFTQPYWYENFPILEIPHTGWHCNMLNSLMSTVTLWPPLPSTVLPEKKVENVEEQLEVYHREFDYACRNDLFYAPTLHPWSLYQFDEKMTVIRSLLSWSEEKGVQVMSYRDVYRIYNSDKENE